jgi:hypothetical protein
MRSIRLALAGALAVALAWVAGPAVAASTVTCGSSSLALSGTNIYRSTNALVEYTPAFGATTGTNQYGYEAAVVNGVVTQAVDGVGNMAIPSNGYVLSGHGTSRTWLRANAPVGAACALDGATPPPPPPPPPGGNPKLPDIGIRTLRNFTIANVNGVKELKFPTVTSNIGYGPFEIHGTRSDSSSTAWTMTQTIYNSDGTKTVLGTPGTTFYYAGDGHNHWHVRDLNDMGLYDASGKKVASGAKHGFCFEDNTTYRDWVTKGTHGAPKTEVYGPTRVCGVGDPSATAVEEGLSVGWGDTYPASLTDQYIDITGVPDGTYKVRVTADWANWYKEGNESNNSATAQVKISGNTVTLLSATDGL